MAGKGGARVGSGRKKGGTNAATREREALAQRILAEQASQPGRKLGREVLDDFMQLFTGLAAYYQPIPKNQQPPADREPDEARFKEYAGFAIKCASELANYQSPKFKAVAVSIETPPGSTNPADGAISVGGVRVVSAMEAYKALRDGDLIELQANKPAASAPAKKRGAA